jgi:hypothetical protein
MLLNNEKEQQNKYKKYSFSQRIVDMWNSLPKQVIETKTVNTFKSQLNNHWQNLEIQFSPDVYRSKVETNLSIRFLSILLLCVKNNEHQILVSFLSGMPGSDVCYMG